MSFMSPKERKMLENEITILKVLFGPTIIRYYDSFIENDSIHIFMEYAEGGSLSEKINDHRKRGVPISSEQILCIFLIFMYNLNFLQKFRLDSTIGVRNHAYAWQKHFASRYQDSKYVSNKK